MQIQQLATRVSSACDRCRRQKQRCDVARPCYNCTNAKRECVSSEVSSSRKARPAKRPRLANRLQDSSHEPENVQYEVQEREQELRSPWRSEHSIVTEFGSSDSALDVTRRLLQHRSPESRATFAIPGGDSRALHKSVAAASCSVANLIGVELPSKATTDKLLNIYFYTVHWFSLVVYEPTFRQRYETLTSTGLATSTDKPFLLLLLMVLVMSCHYGHGVPDAELRQHNLDELRTRYLQVVRSNFMDLMDEDCIEFIQICTLLGSYWLYWGKPRSSFTILGAAVKSAQAKSLHRQASGRHAHGSRQEIEERKRVWWTIYTWDRFATIVYGRPLGISDRDCDVPMPAVFSEYIRDIHSSEAGDVELSPYQINLNRIYKIASPMLENIYSIRNPARSSVSDLAQIVRQIEESMSRWQDTLPAELDLEKNTDLPIGSTLQQRMHHLQALSLRLTHLNLKIIIHRPLLADRNQGARARSQGSRNGSPTDVDLQELSVTSFEQCLEAALALSRLGQNKPNLILLASKTHLLSFLAMNIFTSSVVLFICAMSDVLSNVSQEAKRGMSRNLKILKSFANAGSLASQCSIIVGDLIQLILEKEKDEMLLGPFNVEETGNESNAPGLTHDHLIAVPVGCAQGRSTANHEMAGSLHRGISLDDTTLSFGRTIEQLHRVMKDASHSYSNLRSDADNYRAAPHNITAPELTWPDLTSWNDGQMLASNQDMTQFWLWNVDPYETMSDWPDCSV